METGKAYSALHVKEKAERDGFVYIKGIASTPRVDRMGDIVNPMGAEFQTPMPLLMQHRHDSPVGHVTFAKPTQKGIPFEARLPIIKEPGLLKDRVDEAIHSLQYGLVAYVSIGFSAVEGAVKRLETGGLEFLRWAWHELSLVTIPAQPDAVITSVKSLEEGQDPEPLSQEVILAIKSFDSTQPAASGIPAAESGTRPGVSGKHVVVKTLPKPEETNQMKTLQEQLAGFKAARNQKFTAMNAIMAKSAESGETLDAQDSQAHTDLDAEVDALDTHIKRLEKQIEREASTAQPQTPTPGIPRALATVKASEKVENGMGFARMARVKALAHISHENPEQIAQHLYPDDDGLVKSFQKAAVNAASTTSATWAGNLILDAGGYFGDFVEYSRARSVMGQVSDRMRRLPFDTPVLVQASAGVGKWTAEGDAKPLTSWTYTKTKLTPLKVAAIAAATKEMLSRASVAADTLIRDELVRSVNTAIDGTFVSAAAAVSNESPAGIRNGIAALTLGGDGSVFGIRCDIAQFLKELAGDNLSVAGAFWIMPEIVAIDLSLATNEVGNAAFPGITPTAGTLAGLPVFTSQTVATNVVMLIKGDEIFLGDEGGITVNISDQASLQMDDSPTQQSINTPVATAVVSMFQTNSVAFLVERFLNWQLRRPGAVVWATVNWDPCAGT